jgi:hypothetical protein
VRSKRTTSVFSMPQPEIIMKCTWLCIYRRSLKSLHECMNVVELKTFVVQLLGSAGILTFFIQKSVVFSQKICSLLTWPLFSASPQMNHDKSLGVFSCLLQGCQHWVAQKFISNSFSCILKLKAVFLVMKNCIFSYLWYRLFTKYACIHGSKTVLIQVKLYSLATLYFYAAHQRWQLGCQNYIATRDKLHTVSEQYKFQW